MNTLSILLQAEANPSGNYVFMGSMILIFVIMYFFMIRPQQKKQKELQNFQNSLAAGSQIITQGGIIGTVKGIDEANNTIKVEIASNVCIQVARNAVFPMGEAPAMQQK